jgi:hypothetical protein
VIEVGYSGVGVCKMLVDSRVVILAVHYKFLLTLRLKFIRFDLGLSWRISSFIGLLVRLPVICNIIDNAKGCESILVHRV